ncbi:MAG: hypothetical protein M3O34_05045 [Chloroflexota bacterium]|nr:hypothetical protein [Chloroflexota bacterium]
MPFAWRAFLDLAAELGARSDEAAWRTAIGRAYYAAVGTAYEALPPAERAAITPGMYHTRTWLLYTMSSHRVCRRVGNLGHLLRQMRHECDYRASATIRDYDVRQALTYAREAVALIDWHGYQP